MSGNRVEKFDEHKKEKFFELLREGGRRMHSCKAVGISHQTFYNHIDKDKDFARKVSEAEMQANELVEHALFKKAVSGNTTAIQVWLYNRCPDRWTDKRNVNDNTDNNDKLDKLISAMEKNAKK